MNEYEEFRRKGKGIKANISAKVLGPSTYGWDLELESGAIMRGVRSPNYPHWATDTWVTAIRVGGQWQIEGRSVAAPEV